MADRSITISWATSRYIIGRDDGIRVRFDVLSSSNMDPRIFAFRMLPLNPQTGSKIGHFSHVCSPADLAEFPEDEPLPAHRPEWFRLTYVDVLVRSLDEAEDFITKVRRDVFRLKRTFDRMDVLQDGSQETLGTPPVVDSSSSSSVTSSESSGSGESEGPLQMLSAVGSFAQNVGFGTAWDAIGEGAGSPVGSSDSEGVNFARVRLQYDQVSKMLLIQGFDFSALPETARIVGVEAQLVIRYIDETEGSLGSAASPGPLLSMCRLYDPELGPVGVNKAADDLIEGPDFSTLVLGGEADDWVAGLVAAEVRRGDFGVCLIVLMPGDIPVGTIEVDGVELFLFFRE